MIIHAQDASVYTFEYTGALAETELRIYMFESSCDFLLMVKDLYVMEVARQTGQITLEADLTNVSVTNKNKTSDSAPGTLTKKQAFFNRLKGTIDRLSNFCKDVAERFMNATNDLLKNYNGWIEKEMIKLPGIQDSFWNDCTISCHPYIYNVSGHTLDTFNKSIVEVCQFKNIGESMVARKIAAGFDSKEALDQYLSPKLAKIMKTKENMGYTGAAKEFYRGGEVRKYTGRDAKNLCTLFSKYITNYKTTATIIAKDLAKAKKAMEDIKKDYNEDGTLKNPEKYNLAQEEFILSDDPRLYSVLEGKYLYDIPLFNNVKLVDENGNEIPIIEAVTVDKQNGKANTTQSSNVQVQPQNGNQDAVKPKGANNVGSQTVSKFMAYWKTVVEIQTARMTIAEECFKAGIRTLRSVISSADRRGEISLQQTGNVNAQQPTAKLSAEAK